MGKILLQFLRGLFTLVFVIGLLGFVAYLIASVLIILVNPYMLDSNIKMVFFYPGVVIVVIIALYGIYKIGEK